MKRRQPVTERSDLVVPEWLWRRHLGDMIRPDDPVPPSLYVLFRRHWEAREAWARENRLASWADVYRLGLWRNGR